MDHCAGVLGKQKNPHLLRLYPLHTSWHFWGAWSGSERRIYPRFFVPEVPGFDARRRHVRGTMDLDWTYVRETITGSIFGQRCIRCGRRVDLQVYFIALEERDEGLASYMSRLQRKPNDSVAHQNHTVDLGKMQSILICDDARNHNPQKEPSRGRHQSWQQPPGTFFSFFALLCFVLFSSIRASQTAPTPSTRSCSVTR